MTKQLRVQSVTLLTALMCASSLGAQSGKRTSLNSATTASAIAVRADSVANAGDSVAAYAMLDSAFRKKRLDAASAHAFAMMTGSKYLAAPGKTFTKSGQAVRWMIAADSAFALAVSLAPDSAVYWRDMARFNLSTGFTFHRAGAESWIVKGLAAAARTGDSLMVSDLADEAGMVQWHRFELVADQALDIEAAPVFSWEQQRYGVAIRQDQLVVPPHSFAGFAEYSQARDLFVRAMHANPVNARSRRHLYMTFVARARWPELLRASNEQLKVAPWDYEAWLARGLASIRLFQSKDAAAAFDSALTLMTPEQKSAYTRFTRILPPHVFEGKTTLRDSISFEKLSAADKTAVENISWALLDPIAITPENEFRTEFYARIAYADFRWTAEDLGVRGSDSPRGDLYVRFGPPDRELTFPNDLPPSTMRVWRWNSGFNISFLEGRMLGTARHFDVGIAEALKRSFPIRFDNVPLAKLTDTIGVRVTAFRGNRDSLDIVVASDIPAKKMVGNSELGGELPFNLSSRVIDGKAKDQEVKSTTVRVTPLAAPERMPATWTQRIGAGANFVRVEAYQPDTRRVAHGDFSVDPTRSSAFGMSDVLLGAKLQESSSNANRWSEVKIEPKFGTFGVGEPIGLLWETYKLADDKGNVRYKVNIDVRSAEGGGIKGLVARVRTAVGATLGQGKEKSGVIAVSFPRTAPTRDVTVESMSLDLGSAKPGLYQLKVEVVDAVSGSLTSRVTQFRIVP